MLEIKAGQLVISVSGATLDALTLLHNCTATESNNQFIFERISLNFFFIQVRKNEYMLKAIKS